MLAPDMGRDDPSEAIHQRRWGVAAAAAQVAQANVAQQGAWQTMIDAEEDGPATIQELYAMDTKRKKLLKMARDLARRAQPQSPIRAKLDETCRAWFKIILPFRFRIPDFSRCRGVQ